MSQRGSRRDASWILVAPLLLSLSCGGELSGGEAGGEYGRSSFAPGSVVRVCTPAGLGLNLRSAPGLQSSVIAVLPQGSQATVLGASGAWYKLQAAQTGWAHGSYLCPGAGASAAPSGPAPAGGTFVRFVEPAPGSTLENGVKLRVEASADVAAVRYVCDGYLLRTSSDAASGFAVQYSFSVLGTRTVTAQALSAAGAQLASGSVTITVTWPGGGTCTGGFSHPAPGYPVTDNFGTCRDGCTRTHAGIDVGTPHGTLVHAADGGEVDYAGWASGYGYMIDLLHCGKHTTRYAHLSQLLVKPGQLVSRGGPIARSGDSGVGTGPHLHFEIRVGGPYGAPVDPRSYIAF